MSKTTQNQTTSPATFLAAPEASDPQAALRSVALSALIEDPDNARQTFDKAALQGLADSIKSEGLISPILVVPSGEAGRFVIVDGHRRFRAASILGLQTVPCIIRQDLEEVGVRLAAVLSNLQREDLTPFEQATALSQALATGEVNQKELGQRTGLSVRTIQNRLNLLALGPVIGPMVGVNGFTAEHAQMLAPLADREFFIGLAKPEAKQTQEDADAKLYSTSIDVAIKAIGTGKDTLEVDAAVEAVADALDGAGFAVNAEKDRKLITNSPAFLQAIKKLKHVVLEARGGSSAIVVFDVATYKDKRMAYKAHTKGKAPEGGSKADKAKASKRRGLVQAATELAVRDAILAAKPALNAFAWVALHAHQATAIMPNVVDFAVRLAALTDEKAQNGFRALFKNERQHEQVADMPKWFASLTGEQATRLALGIGIGRQVSSETGQADDVVRYITGRTMAQWTEATDAIVKDEPEPVEQIAP